MVGAEGAPTRQLGVRNLNELAKCRSQRDGYVVNRFSEVRSDSARLSQCWIDLHDHGWGKSDVQVTGDANPQDSGNWNYHDVLFGQTMSANANIAYPVSGIRLNVGTWVSGSVNLAVVQWTFQ